MNRSRLFHSLRIAWSVAFGILCLLLIALWVRSYWRFDYVSGMATANRQVEVFAIQGRLVIGTWAETTFAPWRRQSNPVSDSQATVRIIEPHENALGFAIVKPSLVVPYYFLVFVTGVVVAAPWLPWRFSLRTLLIVTTLAAVGLGVVVYFARP
jgi:hypothetical protein